MSGDSGHRGRACRILVLAGAVLLASTVCITPPLLGQQVLTDTVADATTAAPIVAALVVTARDAAVTPLETILTDDRGASACGSIRVGPPPPTPWPSDTAPPSWRWAARKGSSPASASASSRRPSPSKACAWAPTGGAAPRTTRLR